MSDPAEGPRPWRRVASEPGPDLGLFQVRRDVVEHPGTGKRFDRVVLQASDWVNALALTPDRRVVLVRQYRFGTGEVTTEVPAGLVDPGEEPLEAARRELREETGYTSTRWRLLGSVPANPAFLDNRCHIFLAEGAEQTHPVEWDEGEELAVETVSLEEARAMVLDGRIVHPLAVVALSYLLLEG